MKRGIFTIGRKAEVSIEIKRSRFVGRSFRCSTPEEALAAVRAVREAHKDASHHCWAYRIGISGEQIRYDNSGEPQGTAGPPILDLLKNKGVTNALVVVTRYYGGTKLGAGGLVRAYGEAAKRVVEESGLVELRAVKEIRAPVPYNLLARFQAYLVGEGFATTAEEFGEIVTVALRVPVDREADFRAYYTGLVNGKLSYTVLGETFA